LIQTFSILPVNNASSYTWTVPKGWTISSGQGTTSLQVIAGKTGQNGNLTVTASNTCGTSAAQNLAVTSVTCLTIAARQTTGLTENIQQSLDVKVLPNPANYFFSVTIHSSNHDEKIALRVVDVLGRVVENRGSVTEGKTFKLGEMYRPGIYFVEIVQGKERRIFRLIKQSE
jgi:hypothetical protein